MLHIEPGWCQTCGLEVIGLHICTGANNQPDPHDACRAEVAALRRALEEVKLDYHWKANHRGPYGSFMQPLRWEECPMGACPMIRAALATRGGDATESDTA